MSDNKPAAPASYLSVHTLQTLKPDIISGFLVFLIALPLCLGISMASGFPPVSGILTAIIGGVLVSLFRSSQLTIKGPAAGLIVIALASVEELGQGNPYTGYTYTLAVIVVASVLQIIFALIRSGFLSEFFPSTTVHGMMTAIGIMIVSRQLFTLAGIKPLGNDTFSLWAEIPDSISLINPGIILIGVLSLIILFALTGIKNTYLRKIPAPLIVILIAIPLGRYFNLQNEHVYLFLNQTEYSLGPGFLVSLPDNLFSAITFPDFSILSHSIAWKYILMFSVVGSLETLLSTKATDALDPWHRKSNMNRDLLGVGVGNVISGFIGGLPMISEIVRSSANVNNGGKTWKANFFHGIFMLLFVALFPALLHQIPLSALAAMLIYTGFRLASPYTFYRIYKIGKEQLLVFLITIFVTLYTDILQGILAGMLCMLIMQIWHGVPFRYIFRPLYMIKEDESHFTVKVINAVVFSNYVRLKTQLERIPQGKHIKIDLSHAAYIDHPVMENLEQFKLHYIRKGGICEINGLDDHNAFSAHPHSTRKFKNQDK